MDTCIVLGDTHAHNKNEVWSPEVRDRTKPNDMCIHTYNHTMLIIRTPLLFVTQHKCSLHAMFFIFFFHLLTFSSSLSCLCSPPTSPPAKIRPGVESDSPWAAFEGNSVQHCLLMASALARSFPGL